MKMICFGLLLGLLSVQNSQAATCRDLYSSALIESRWDQNLGSDLGKVGTTVFVAGGATAVVGLGAAVVAGTISGALIPAGLVVAGFGAYEGYIVLANSKENKMIKLIDQATLYDRRGGVPGKTLRKLYAKVNKNSSLTISELARFISESNRNGSLCSTEESLSDISRAIKSGDVKVVTLEE